MTPETLPGDVSGSHDRLHSVQFLSHFDIDRQDTGARQRSAQNCRIQHFRRLQVIDIFTCPECLGRGIKPCGPSPHAGGLRFLPNGYFASQHPGCQHNRLFNFHVACTAANISPQGFLDPCGGRRRVFIQQRFGADHHPRGAKSALHGANFGKRPGIRLFFPLSQPLDSNHIFILHAA